MDYILNIMAFIKSQVEAKITATTIADITKDYPYYHSMMTLSVIVLACKKAKMRN